MTKKEVVDNYSHDYRNMEMEKSELREVFEKFGEEYHDSYHNIECSICGEVYNPGDGEHKCEEDEEDIHPQRYGDQER